ncbi:MAG: GGDEF domain-containing protein [Syntrophobacteraceae bacterium]
MEYVDSDQSSKDSPCEISELDGASFAAQLRTENEELRNQLDQVVSTAAANEKIWRHFAEIEKILFRTRQLDALVEELLREIKIRFQPDQVILFLCNPDVMERFFPDISRESQAIGDGAWILPFPADAAFSLIGDVSKPFLLSPEGIESLLNFLPEDAFPLQSGVFIPLSIHEILFGGLFLGSIDGSRYRPQDGTDLLDQLAIKIALCMDNCLAYERMKNFELKDPLTGLLNFFQIHAELDLEFRRARRAGTPLSLLMVSPNFYHQADGPSEIGNDILKHVADVLSEIFPQEDSILGRYGSDEFLVLLPNVLEEEAREVLPYLTRMIRKSPFKMRNAVILIQAAIGVGTLKEDMERSQDLLDDAYTELCHLKSSRLEGV